MVNGNEYNIIVFLPVVDLHRLWVYQLQFRCSPKNDHSRQPGAFPEIFSIRMLWFQGIFTIFGGGSLVISTLFHVVFTDVTPESQR